MDTTLIQTSHLLDKDREEMHDLLSCHFDGTSWRVFETDLALKNWVILLRDEKAKLQGFSTLFMYDVPYESSLITVVYSGDTIVDPQSWSSAALSQAWIASVRKLKQQYDGTTLYWLLISSGFRTYRFLPTFWKTFYPNYRSPTPLKMTQLADFLSQRQFGEWYNPATGIVTFPSPQRLRQHLSSIPSARLRNPHVRYFAERNPGAAAGDELVCITEISEENLTRAGRRMWFGTEEKEHDLSCYQAKASNL